MSGHDEVRLFKRSVIAWTLRVAVLLLLIAAAIGGREVTLGLAFGLCIGLVNFDLMTRFNASLLRSGERGAGVAVVSMLVRLALLAAAAAGVLWKGWNLIAAAVGFFLVYPVLFAHGLFAGHRAGHRPATPPVDAEG